MPTNEPSGNDLTTHIGSCLYRERIAKEERNLRREWERPVPEPEVNPHWRAFQEQPAAHAAHRSS